MAGERLGSKVRLEKDGSSALRADFKKLTAHAAVTQVAADILLPNQYSSMQLPRYELKTGQNLNAFESVSAGSKGRITKVIQFEPTEVEGVYNRAFGDQHPITNELDDKAVTANGDTEQVLATVVAAVYAFAEYYPAAWMYATSSTPARTRLYQMGIHKYFNLIVADFDLLGERNSEWEPYEYGTTYQALAARRKPAYI